MRNRGMNRIHANITAGPAIATANSAPISNTGSLETLATRKTNLYPLEETVYTNLPLANSNGRFFK